MFPPRVERLDRERAKLPKATYGNNEVEGDHALFVVGESRAVRMAFALVLIAAVSARLVGLGERGRRLWPVEESLLRSVDASTALRGKPS